MLVMGYQTLVSHSQNTIRINDLVMEGGLLRGIEDTQFMQMEGNCIMQIEDIDVRLTGIIDLDFSLLGEFQDTGPDLSIFHSNDISHIKLVLDKSGGRSTMEIKGTGGRVQMPILTSIIYSSGQRDCLIYYFSRTQPYFKSTSGWLFGHQLESVQVTSRVQM